MRCSRRTTESTATDVGFVAWGADARTLWWSNRFPIAHPPNSVEVKRCNAFSSNESKGNPEKPKDFPTENTPDIERHAENVVSEQLAVNSPGQLAENRGLFVALFLLLFEISRTSPVRELLPQPTSETSRLPSGDRAEQ